MGTFAGKLPPRAGARCPGQPTACKVDHASPPRWRCDRDATLSRRRPASPSGFKLGCAAAPGRRGSPWGGCAQLELEPGPAAGAALWPRGAQPAVAPGSTGPGPKIARSPMAPRPEIPRADLALKFPPGRENRRFQLATWPGGQAPRGSAIHPETAQNRTRPGNFRRKWPSQARQCSGLRT